MELDHNVPVKTQQSSRCQGKQGGQNSSKHLISRESSKQCVLMKDVTQKDIDQYKASLDFSELESHTNMVHHVINFLNGTHKNFKYEACHIFIMINWMQFSQEMRSKEVSLEPKVQISQLIIPADKSGDNSNSKKNIIYRDMSFGIDVQTAEKVQINTANSVLNIKDNL